MRMFIRRGMNVDARAPVKRDGNASAKCQLCFIDWHRRCRLPAASSASGHASHFGAVRAAVILADAHQQGMIFVVERRVGGQGGLEVVFDFVVVGVVADPAVAGEDAVRVRVDDKRRQAAGVEQDRVGRFGADAVDRQQLLAKRRQARC